MEKKLPSYFSFVGSFKGEGEFSQPNVGPCEVCQMCSERIEDGTNWQLALVIRLVINVVEFLLLFSQL